MSNAEGNEAWAAPKSAPVIAAAGWKMVPIEPTIRMISVGFDAYIDSHDRVGIASAWDAMLAASPSVAAITASNDRMAELERERDEARQIVRDIFWMALRYADGRMTYAVDVVNAAVRKGYDGGWITPKDTGGDPVTPRFARDGMLPEWTEPVARAEAAEAKIAEQAEAGATWNDDMRSAPKMTPVLVRLGKRAVGQRDGMHGAVQVAANRGRGWISIPGMWSCNPIAWCRIPADRAALAEIRSGK